MKKRKHKKCRCSKRCKCAARKLKKNIKITRKKLKKIAAAANWLDDELGSLRSGFWFNDRDDVVRLR
jgi:hypothetical protein